MNLPEGAKVIGVKLVYKKKLNERGENYKFKARLVVKGYHQIQGVDYHKVFVPVAKVGYGSINFSIGSEEDLECVSTGREKCIPAR